MAHWTEDTQDRGKLLAHIARIVLGVPLGQPVEAPMLRDAVVMLAKDMPGIDWKSIGHVDTAIITWDVWWSKNASDFYLSLVGDINMITVSASVRAGNSELSIGLRLVPLDTGIHRQIAYAVKTCNILLEQQAASIGVQVNRSGAAGGGGSAARHSTAKTITFQADKIVISHDGKARRAKVVGAQFTQYGVPLYPEHAAQFGLNLDEMSMGETEWKHKVVAELDDNNKPKRVINLKAD